MQYNILGNKLATCGSDGKIVIYDIDSGVIKKSNELVKHDGPIWRLSWAHSKFGNILASCSYDKSLIIWKEISKNNWEEIYKFDHKESVNCICFSPPEYGLLLLSVSSDGSVAVHEYNSNFNFILS